MDDLNRDILILDIFFGLGGDDDDDGRIPLTEEEISQIPAVTVVPSGEVCTICLLEFGEGSEVIRQLPCNHFFHEDCIIPWLQTSNTCPVCRHQLGEGPRFGDEAEHPNEDSDGDSDVAINDSNESSFNIDEILEFFQNHSDAASASDMSIEMHQSSAHMSIDEETARIVTVLPPGENLNPVWIEESPDGGARIVEFNIGAFTENNLRPAHLTDLNTSPAYNTRSATARRMRLNRSRSRSPLTRQENTEDSEDQNSRDRRRRRR